MNRESIFSLARFLCCLSVTDVGTHPSTWSQFDINIVRRFPLAGRGDVQVRRSHPKYLGKTEQSDMKSFVRRVSHGEISGQIAQRFLSMSGPCAVLTTPAVGFGTGINVPHCLPPNKPFSVQFAGKLRLSMRKLSSLHNTASWQFVTQLQENYRGCSTMN